MIKDYLNQTASHEAYSSINDYAEPSYSAAVSIACRKEGVNKLIRDAEGKEVVTSSRVFTETLINVKDRIDGRMILRVDPMPNLDGSISHYEVYLA